MRNGRALARTGAVSLLALGAMAVAATPALAADGADLSVTMTGTSLAATVDGKDANLTVTNNSASDGPTATNGWVRFDTSGLDTTKVTLDTPDGCQTEADGLLCGLGDIKPGENADYVMRLVAATGASGDAGTLTVEVGSDGTDPDPKNNVTTVPVSIEGSGIDLGVWAPDVYAVDSEGYYTDQGVTPGENSVVWAEVVNQGDVTAAGINVVVSLPEHVTFADTEEDCTYSTDNRTATCAYSADQIILPPIGKDPDNGYGWFYWPVTVDAGTTVASLPDGAVSVAAMGTVVERPSIAANVAPQAPGNFTREAPKGIDSDVDPSDNTDEFTVFVALKTPGSDQGGQGGGSSLPVTGAQAGLIGGIGALVLAIGAVLMVAARRRRVVVVSSTDDEAPTD